MPAELIERVQHAIAHRTPLCIQGGGSKAFYGRACAGEALDVSSHRGIVAYEPTELVITARAGTPLAEIEAALAANNQMLPFEPPHFSSHLDVISASLSSPSPFKGEVRWGMGATPSELQPILTPTLIEPLSERLSRQKTAAKSLFIPLKGREHGATLGGMVASGLSGPRRPWGGSVRDAVLGVKLLNGRGEVLRLGGQVMKNVAGYDVSRLMVGALGTLGVLLEVSIKVLPRPACERTLRFDADARPLPPELPISASLQVDGQRYLRLSASSRCVEMAAGSLGGIEADPEIWTAVRDQTLPFFQTGLPLWRISVPAAAPDLAIPGPGLIEWGGAQRWLASDMPANMLRQRVAAFGGHATLFRGHAGKRGAGEIFQPLPPAMLALHQRVKAALDPHGIFNPGRMYPEL